MALTQLTTWVNGGPFTAAAINAEFQQIYTQTISLISPLTGTLNVNGNTLTIDAGGGSSIDAATNNIIDFNLNSVDDLFMFDGSTTGPITGLRFIAGATTVNPKIRTTGEADTGLVIENLAGEEMLIIEAVDNAVNELTILPAVADSNPIIKTTGTTDNTGIEFQQKDGDTLLIIESVDAGVNELTISNAATGANPTIACTGESDIGITLQNQDAEPMLVLDSVATTTNWVKITAAAGGADATITGDAVGADAGLTLQGKGAGTLKLGDASLIFPDSDGAANSVMVSNGSTTLSLTAATYSSGPAASSILPLPRNYLAGCQLTYTDQNTITIAVGVARNTGDDTNLILSSTMAKDIDTTWAAGTGNGGLNATDFASGSSDCEADTWYHVFLIENGSGTVDAGFDKSINASNLRSDSGYTKYRRIGSVRTDASKNILSFTQTGDNFAWTVPTQDIDDATLGDGETEYTLKYSPPDVKCRVWFNARVTASSDVRVWIYDTSMTGVIPALSAAPLASIVYDTNNGFNGQVGPLAVMTDINKIIAAWSSIASTTLETVTLSYDDWRGKQD